VNEGAIPRILWGLLFAAGWLGLSWLLRHPMWATIKFTLTPDPSINFDQPNLETVAFYVGRLMLFFVTGLIGIGITFLLKTASPGSLVPERYRLMDSATPDPHPGLARALFIVVVIFAVAPPRWLSTPLLGGPALYAIAVTMLGIQFIAAIGMGEAIGPVMKLDRQKQPPPLYFFGALLFSLFAIFMSLHLPSYGLSVLRGTMSFAEARRHLLMLHALAMWCALPMYVLGTHDRRIVWNFVKLNLWFLPWPRVLATSEEVGGGLSGGAGASGSF